MFSKKKLDYKREQELLAFQKNTNLKFKDINMLELAFSHRSYANEHNLKHDNEKLEFVGDSVLGLVIASELYNIMPNDNEGNLAKAKSIAVSESVLAEIALEFSFDKYLKLGNGEDLSGGRLKKAILADSVEAVIGSYFLDAGFEKARKFVLKLFENRLQNVVTNKDRFNYKNMLQEFTQKKFKVMPKYHLQDVVGPEHDRIFWITVSIKNFSYGPVSGKTKKEAEQVAAKLAYNDLTNDISDHFTKKS